MVGDKPVPSIDQEDSTNAYYSFNLVALLLKVCLDGDALAPFINATAFENKGKEMLHLLKSNAYRKSKSATNAIMANLHTVKIKQDESFEKFGNNTHKHSTLCKTIQKSNFFAIFFSNRVSKLFWNIIITI